MFGVVRVGDQCIGFCNHGSAYTGPVMGFLNAGSATSMADNQPIGRVGDMYVTNCPICGFGQASAGSPDAMVDNLPIHRMGDQVMLGGGMANASTASVTTMVD